MEWFKEYVTFRVALKQVIVLFLITTLSSNLFPLKSSRIEHVRNIINTLGELEISNKKREELQKAFLFMNINAAISDASDEALKIEKKAQIWAERVRLTSMFFFGNDIPLIDKLKEYQDEIKRMGSVGAIGKALDYSGKVVKIDAEMRSLYNNINKFQKDKNLHQNTRNALALLWGTGRIVNWLGGSVPLVGDVIKSYGSFLSNFSIIIKKNYSFLSRRGGEGEIIGRDPNVRDYKGQPAETELYVATDRKVLIIKDLEKPGKGGGIAYFIKFKGKWHVMSVPQYHNAVSIVSDWISAFHEPEGGFWDWVSRKSYNLRKYLKGREIKARNTYPGTEIVAEMITNPKKKISGLGLNRYELGYMAKKRLEDLADLRVMNFILGGIERFDQVTLKEFRRKREWLSKNLPKLGISLSPNRERAFLRALFENNNKFQQAIRNEALKLHPGAEKLLRCRGVNPDILHLTVLAERLNEYRQKIPIERFQINVNDKESGAPLEGVRITFNMTKPCTSIDLRKDHVIKITGYDGSASFVIPFGCYKVKFYLKGYYVRETDKPFCITEEDNKNSVVISMEKIKQDSVDRRKKREEEYPIYKKEKKQKDNNDQSLKSKQTETKSAAQSEAEILAEFRSLYPRYQNAIKAKGATIKVIHNASKIGPNKYRVASETWRVAEEGNLKGKLHRSSSGDWVMSMGELKALVIKYKKYFKIK